MGCAGSKQCTPEQQQAVWSWGCKEMLRLSIRSAINKTDQIKVGAPADDTRSLIQRLRSEASKASNSHEEAQVQSTASSGGGGGMLGGLGAMAGGMMQKGLTMAQAGADAVMAKSLATMADGLETALVALDKPFTDAAQEVAEHKEDVVNAFSSIIEETDVTKNSKDLLNGRVRKLSGNAPTMESRRDSCTMYLAQQYQKNLLASLMSTPACDGIKAHPVTQAWRGFVDTYNDVNQKLGASEALKMLQQPFMDVDLTRYIADQTIQQLCVIMGAEETALRADPNNKSSQASTKDGKPMDTFAYCFNPNGIHEGTDLIYWLDLNPQTKNKE